LNVVFGVVQSAPSKVAIFWTNSGDSVGKNDRPAFDVVFVAAGLATGES
jgi:hypothetical protein